MLLSYMLPNDFLPVKQPGNSKYLLMDTEPCLHHGRLALLVCNGVAAKTEIEVAAAEYCVFSGGISVVNKTAFQSLT